MKNKNNQTSRLKNVGKLPTWDLKDLYKSANSKELINDLKYIKIQTKRFEKRYINKVSSLNSKQLFECIKNLELIDLKMDKILSYAHLRVAENGKDEKNKIFFQRMQEEITKYASSILFFNIEINQINEKKIIKLIKDTKLSNYKYWITRKRSFKPYQLDLNLEKMIQDKNLTSHSAWIRLFDDTIASLKFPFKKKLLSSTEIFNLLSDKNSKIRQIAAKSAGNVLQDNIRIFSMITNTLAKDKSINDSWRKLPKPVSARNLSNVVEDRVIDSLAKSVVESYSKLSHRYYSIKAKWLDKKHLMYWDRNAPLPFQNNRIYSWKEARDIVLSAYTKFNPLIGNIAKKFFDQSWIHAPVLDGKSPGAFAASTVAEVHPFILVNFQGKARDVATLAHELGHGIHQYLAGEKQTHFNTATPLTLAETASVFGEMLTFKSLLKNSKDRIEKKALLANKVEDMLNTVVRQISFYEFEKKLHDLRKKSELSIDTICSLWMEEQKKSLGPAIKYEDEYKYYWSYIPHFIHSPFYVYAYAFGDCLVNSLYKVYENGLIDFDKKYIRLLESGGSQNYINLLKPFNLNPKNKLFWKKGLGVIDDLINQLDT